ncbi:MAG: Rossmann-like domain-containing protein [Promethearchaeota archaeon]
MSDFLKNTRTILEKKFLGLTIPETRGVLIGRGYQAVLLEGTMGVGFAPRKALPTCTILKKPGRLYQTPATELADYVLSEEPIARSVGIGAINALSQLIIDDARKEQYFKYLNKDMLKLLPLNKDTKVGMVGRIRPFVKFLAKNSARLTIVDDNPAIPVGQQVQNAILTRNLEEIEDSDIVIITGSTVIEHSLEMVLKVVKDAVFKVIVGPTASWIPDASFKLGIDAVGGMRFKELDKAFRVIMEGGGTMNFTKYVEKYILTKEEHPNLSE